MAKYGMVIDLQRCSGCAGCVVACKNENNIPDGYFWAHHITTLGGTFPNVSYEHIPTLCNHCDDAPCVNACPTDPKSMYKDDKGRTLHNPETCISCQMCKNACPYDVIEFDAKHNFWLDEKGKEVTAKVDGNVIPYYNPNRALTYDGIRRERMVEKCTFCDHRESAANKQPWCVDSCPANARIFGDLDDPNSAPSKLLSQYSSTRLKEEAGTGPNVYYIRKYNRK